MFRRMFRNTKARGEAPVAPVRQMTPAAPMPVDPHATPSLADYEHELHATNTQLLRERVETLRAVLPEAESSRDAARLLDSLLAPAVQMIRQPPAAAQRALDASRDDEVGSAEMSRLFEEDPSLSQALLRFANSAYYATSSASCVSVPGALQRVGFSGVQNVVLARMIEGFLCRPGVAFQPMVDQVWTHMVRTAPLARALAPEFGMKPDAAFALGLLHDVGKLVVFDRLGALRTELRRELRIPVPVVSRILTRVHEPLGALAALQWSMGGMCARGIGTHHRSPVPVDPSMPSELLFLAERVDLARARGQELDLGAWWETGGLMMRRAGVEKILAAAAE